MADFVAVLRKTIGTLGDNTPEMREKVFDKARSTIEAKLAAIVPPPPEAVADRQRKALADAIAVVRADYDTQAAADNDGDLEDVFASLKSMGEIEPAAPAPVAASPHRPTSPAVATAVPPPVARVERSVSSPPDPAPAVAPTVAAAPAMRRDPVLDPVVDPATDPVHGAEKHGEHVASSVRAGAARQTAARPVSKRKGRFGPVAALAAVLLLVAGGYALWLNSADLFGSSPALPPVAEAPAEEGVTTAEELNATPPDEEPAAGEQDVAAVAPQVVEPAPAAVAPAAADEPKFTQRLMADGSEVDDGPAGGARTIGEGTSVASAVQPSAQAETGDSQPEAEAAPTAGEQAAEPATPAVAVGQRAIFYEERTSAAQGSAEMGSIVWSIVQESPGGDMPPEPAIRAEAAVPGKDVQLRMTIRRNGDQTLPASHIVEMIFLTPDGFEGGSIANVSRIAFKDTEQAAGSALVGIPAKIADGFFLIALGDSPAEIEANMNLLRRQSWIDIPIVYQTGRRALLTLEKGIPGERVFEEAVRAWSEASSG